MRSKYQFYLADTEWIGDKTPLTLCDVRVSPSNSVKPNIGVSELAEALTRVLPFTATEDTRPILQCVNFIAKEGKLTLVDFFIELHHPAGQMKVVATPVKFHQNPASVRTPAPEVGQHNEEILLDLGYSWDDISQLKEQGVIL